MKPMARISLAQNTPSGRLVPAKQARGGLISALIGEGASLDADRFLESVVEASAPKAFPAVDIGGGVRPAGHEGEPPMTELDQMIGDKLPAADIVAGHAECVDVQRAPVEEETGVPACPHASAASDDRVAARTMTTSG